MVTYIRSDLEFILDQIKIAEAHAAGQPLYGPGGLIPSYNISWGLRTVDGSYNHLLPGQERWGAADVEFPTLLDPDYRPADGTAFDPDGPGGAPAVPTAEDYTPSTDPNSLVFDANLRTISNLIVDQTLGNPAAVLEALERAGDEDPMDSLAEIALIYQAFKPTLDAEYDARVALQNATPETIAALTLAHDAAVAALEAARVTRDAALSPYGIAMDGDNVHLPNISPDVGLSAPFNSWFTLFGQFFDHGLDLVNKGGSGTVFIPLQPDDPLYVEGAQTNFMVLTRATVTADTGPVNTTTAYVDQNQTYTSHASHQVFLRQYEMTPDGPVATGKLIEGGGGSPGGMATWGEVKAQALMLGILLTDQDVGSVPLLRTDQYGNFIPDEAGYAQVITGIGADLIPNTADDIVISGTPTAPVALTNAIRTGHAFLADIAHDAVPNGLEDGDIEIGLDNPGNNPLVYDNELLDAHFIAGDGRVNENIGLTAVHHVFHSEHNRLVDHTKEVVVADAQALLAGGADMAEAVAFLNEWLAVDVLAVPVTPAEVDSLVWDGERLFQAAKFGTEMQYQHLVFEEFARKVQPQVDFFVVPDGFDTTINPDIVAEFAHVVYRFGHSMLTESIDRFSPEFQDDEISLIDGFLNPIAFDGGQTVADGLAAGDIVRGMTRQVGNEIDEFVTSALRNNLLGLPLDLATINLARGRDTGVPSLNAARQEFYEATNNAPELRPYESWIDFAGNLKNEASIINFIAAYGMHETILSATTIEAKRDAAISIIFGTGTVPTDAEDFLNSAGVWATMPTGLDNVDLWIGGLAEKILPFGGMLGSTFNFVFETQMEKLQNGDRFYYLQRLDGLHLFGEMEANSFASLIMRNTNATHLPSDVFSTPGLILEVDQTKQFNDLNGDGILESGDPVGGTQLTPLVIRNNPGTVGPDGNYLRYTGDEHVVLGGTEGDDIITSSEGDDTIYGDGGDDIIQGGAGNDIINAGAGDDIVRDLGGDDNIKLGDGNDVLNTGPGLDLVLGGRGQDFIVLGNDAGTEVFAGEGNDFILGNLTAERILGNEGDDWIEHGTFDGAPGDNFDEIFARDGIRGNDVFFGLGGFDEFIGEGGDDIMVGSPGVGKMLGMSGFDWVIYKDNTIGTDADLLREAFDATPVPPPNSTLDVYEAVEGLSGSDWNDVLSGSNDNATTRVPLSQGGSAGFLGSALDLQGIQLIAGLQDLLGTGVTSFSAGDIILGGDGNDVIQGRGGDDIIDGDKWLNVRISVRENIDGTGAQIAGAGGTADSMTQLVGRMFNGTINPGQLKIVREILTADGSGDIDTVVYSGNRSEYTLTPGVPGRLMIAHTGGTQVDGVDTIMNVERAQFADMTIDLNTAATGEPQISDQTPTEGQPLTANLGTIADDNGIQLGTVTYQWQRDGGTGFVNIAGATNATFTPLNAHVNGPLRVVVSFADNLGFAEQRTSAPTIVVGDLFVGGGGVDVYNGTLGQDILSGGGGNDTLFGDAGDDTLNGNGGADTLDGGIGIDTMVGGAGNDIYRVDHADDVVTEIAGPGQGTDTVQTTLTTYTLGDNVERLASIAALDFTGIGNELNNIIDGAGGADTLSGLGGNDILRGQDGNDTLNGGDGNDNLAGANGNDTLNGDSGNDTLNGGSGDDLIAGGTDNDNLIGGDGNDTLNGDGGIDTLNGGAGDDVMAGGTENDNLIGGGGNDTINGDSGNDTLNGGGGSDSLAGGDGDDTLIGAAGNDILVGGLGNDTLNGGAGADVLEGGDGNDVFVYNAIGESGPNAVTRDTIIGFLGGEVDTIDLSGIAGLTEFVFLGTGAFVAGASNQIRFQASGASDTLIQLDTDNDIGLESSILLQGFAGTLVSTDFIL